MFDCAYTVAEFGTGLSDQWNSSIAQKAYMLVAEARVGLIRFF